MKKRILGIMIAIVMVVGLLPAFAMIASAAETDTWDGTAASQAWDSGSGTETNPYIIMTAEQLAKLAADVNGGTTYASTYFKLGANLDLAGTTYNWTPIGKSSTYSFKGVFDGDCHTISNLKITSTGQYVGMFGYVNGGTIKNIVLESPDVSTTYSAANASVGALVGYHSGSGNIEYCAVQNGSVSVPNSTCANTYSGLGGVVGCHNTSGKVIGCYNYMTDVSTKDNTMTRCGGVAGSVNNAAESCYTYNTAQKGITPAGNFESGSGSGYMKYCVHLKADGTESSSLSTSTYSAALSAEEFANGKAAYFLRTGTYSNVDNPWGQDVEGDTKETMPVWNGAKVFPVQWIQDVEGNGTLVTVYANELETKEIDGKTYRVIYDVYDWVLFANLVNTNSGNTYPNRGWNAIVEPAGATIDFSALGTLAYHSGSYQKVVTIGTGSNTNASYNGTFNGNGCKIAGLRYESAYNYGSYALFGYTGTNAYISGITVENATLSSTANHYLSTFVREHKGTIENCHAVNVNLTSAKSNTGGITYNSQGTIKNCSFSGTVNSGSTAGGISSTASSGAQFINCWNEGSVSGKTTSASYGNYAGGILGQEANGVTIDHCYNTGDITGYYAGGIVGSRYGYGTVSNCHSYDAVLTGNSTAPIAKGAGVSNCYYLADSETDTVDGTTYKTAEEFSNGTVAALLNGTGSVWEQGTDHPEIKELVYYRITVTAAENGTVVAGKSTAAEGDVITLTVTPAENYALTSLTVTDADGNPVAVADNKFTMPAKAVTVAATFTFQKITLTEADFTISGLNTEYNMSAQSVTITNLPDGLEGYVTIKYYKNGDQLMGAPTNAGAYKVRVEISGSPDYNDVRLTYDMTINPIQLSAGQISVGSVLEEIVYNGAEQKPTVYIDLGGIPFDATAYFGTVTYSNNINAGTATVVLSGNFEGTATFEIKKATPIISAAAPLDKVMGGYVMEITPTTSAIDNFLNPTTFTVLGGEGYSATGNTITIDNGVAIGSTIKVKIQSTETTNYTAAEGELVLTVGVPTADTTELEAKIAELEEKLGKLDETFATDQELKDAVDSLQAEIGLLKAADADAAEKIVQINQAIADLENVYAKKVDLEAAKTELQNAINSKADTATLDTKVQQLQEAIEAAEAAAKAYADTQDTALKQQLETAIETAKSEVIASAETLVNNAKTELQAAIDKKADTTTLNAKVQELKTAIETAEATAKTYADTKDTALKQQLEAAIANAKQEAIDTANEALANAKTELNAVIAKKADITALEKAISDLNAAITLAQTTAQNFATDADAALKLALEAEIKAAKTELNDAISELERRVKANEEKIAQIKKNLEEAVEKLDKVDTKNAEELAKAVDKLNKAIDEAKAAAVSGDKALEAKIAAAEKKLDEKIAQVQNNLDKATAELDAAMKSGDKALADKIAALQTELATTKELLEKADAKNNAELVTKLENADKVLDAAVKAVQKNLDDAKAELEKAIADGDTALEGKIANLNAALAAAETALESADKANKAELTAKISENYKTLDAAVKAVQKNLDDAKAELEKAIADGDTALESKISELNTALAAAKAALESADATNKAELTATVDEINATLNAAIKAVQKNLDNTKAELKKAIKSGDAALEAKISDLNDALAAAKAALEAADTANKAELTSKIDDAYKALEAAIKAVQKDLNDAKAELEAKDRALEAKTDELQTMLMIVAVISGVTLCGGAAFVIWFFYDRKKKD